MKDPYKGIRKFIRTEKDSHNQQKLKSHKTHRAVIDKTYELIIEANLYLINSPQSVK